jgi:RNA polymerase sigma factor (sigma-70 family)
MTIGMASESHDPAAERGPRRPFGRHADPLRDPKPLIRRVYSYVAYRIGDGQDAEDVTGEVFVRAVRYRTGYDRSRGDAAAWVLGIARRVLAEHLESQSLIAHQEVPDVEDPRNLETESVDRLSMAHLLRKLSERDRELLSLRFGADLKARQIAQVLDLETNTVEVALKRALERMRDLMSRAGLDDHLASQLSSTPRAEEL